MVAKVKHGLLHHFIKSMLALKHWNDIVTHYTDHYSNQFIYLTHVCSSEVTCSPIIFFLSIETVNIKLILGKFHLSLSYKTRFRVNNLAASNSTHVLLFLFKFYFYCNTREYNVDFSFWMISYHPLRFVLCKITEMITIIVFGQNFSPFYTIFVSYKKKCSHAFYYH